MDPESIHDGLLHPFKELKVDDLEAMGVGDDGLEVRGARHMDGTQDLSDGHAIRLGEDEVNEHRHGFFGVQADDDPSIGDQFKGVHLEFALMGHLNARVRQRQVDVTGDGEELHVDVIIVWVDGTRFFQHQLALDDRIAETHLMAISLVIKLPCQVLERVLEIGETGKDVTGISWVKITGGLI